MKALSLKQPFAELILQGRKKIELRNWNTKFRGEFFIHASRSIDSQAMKKFGFNQLPTGCIVGKVTLVDVKKYKDEAAHVQDNHLHLASWQWGKYGFILKNPLRIKRINTKGKLGFWEFSV